MAYDLPGTAGARILWGTGRGNYQRTGSYLQGNLNRSLMSAQPVTPGAGETVTYNIRLINPGPDLETVVLTNTIPADVTYSGNLSASSGSASYTAGQVRWQGTVPGGLPVGIRYTVFVNGNVTNPQPIVNNALVNDGLGNLWPLSSTIIANGEASYLPVTVRK